MNLMLLLAVVGLFTAAGPSLAANDPAQAADTHASAAPAAPATAQSFIPRSPKDPFHRVFRAQDLTDPEKLRARVAAELLRADPSRTDVICGLTMRYVDERNDPHIIVRQQDQAADAKIRRIVPDVCRREPSDGSARTAR